VQNKTRLKLLDIPGFSSLLINNGEDVMEKIKQNIITQLFIIILILLIGGIIFYEMVPYFSGVLGAITLYVILNPFQKKLEALGLKPSIAAALLIVISILMILIPVSLFITMLSFKISRFVENSDKYINQIKEKLSGLEQALGFDIMKGDSASKAADWLSKHAGGLVGSILVIVVAVGIMYFLLYYMLVNREKMYDTLMSYFPLRRKNMEIISGEGDSLIKANAIGLPVVAVSQGIVSLIGFLIAGAPDPFFWFMIATVTSFIPYGTAIGILPVAVILYSSGDQWQSIFILVYGFAVVGATDNVLRMTILKKIQNVHPIITLIGVIIGVPLFGFMGILFGPVMISLFPLIVKLYKQEYGTKSD